MYIIKQAAIIVNILAVISLLIGLFYTFEQPKNKAIYGYCVAGSMIIYIIMLCIAGLYGLITNDNLYSLVLFLCAISPFVIGKFVKYETLKKYTVVQIMFFIFSLVTLLLKF